MVIMLCERVHKMPGIVQKILNQRWLDDTIIPFSWNLHNHREASLTEAKFIGVCVAFFHSIFVYLWRYFNISNEIVCHFRNSVDLIENRGILHILESI